VITEKEKREREIRQKLDEVVGTDFDAPLARGVAPWLRARWIKWLLGALFGRTEEEAFLITCDRTTMTLDDILYGRLICEIGIAPVRPAEFVVFRIFQSTAESQR